MEEVVLTAPLQTRYRVKMLYLFLDGPNSVVRVLIASNGGDYFNHSYSGTVAETLIKSLNTANLSTKSLHRRIIERLQTDAVLAGTIEGIPDA